MLDRLQAKEKVLQAMKTVKGIELTSLEEEQTIGELSLDSIDILDICYQLEKDTNLEINFIEILQNSRDTAIDHDINFKIKDLINLLMQAQGNE